MIKHSETRSLNYSSDQMFSLVADIESYPSFIPWCSSSKITSRNDGYRKGCEILEAELRVSFKLFSETFTSKVFLDLEKKEITVESLTGPFTFLNNRWTFIEDEFNCKVSFYVEFEFRSKIMQKLTGVVFNEAMRRIVKSFEKRADDLFGC